MKPFDHLLRISRVLGDTPAIGTIAAAFVGKMIDGVQGGRNNCGNFEFNRHHEHVTAKRTEAMTTPISTNLPHDTAYGVASSATSALNKVSWGAIFAGVAIALSTQLLLNLLGVGIGAASMRARLPRWRSTTLSFYHREDAPYATLTLI
jgi:hypothetical protein